ncbi:AraC family transcriptional regulator ligand-binding domain-containing protein [Hyphomonas sp.]|uniref:AraC family transcriptional regulator n=1 Tax=Hyphomonas sp. TaxID=87 RepID=UPI00391CE83C
MALGAPAEALYELVPGGRAALNHPDKRFPVPLMAEVLNTAAALTGIDSIGLRVGMQFRPATFLDVGYALAAAGTIKEALEINMRYQPLTQEAARTRLEIVGREARIILEPAVADAEHMRRVTDAILAGYASIGRWLLWDQEKPVAAVALRHRPPSSEAQDFARQLYGDVVSYNAPRDMMVIDAALVTRPLPNANPALVQLLTGRLNARLAAFRAGSSLRMLVISGLHQQMRKGKPSLEDTARLIGMSGRTLRRRLLAEDLSYSDLLAATRKEAAEVYIHEETLSFAEIAGLLGYSDQTAFVRAFRGWFGEPPGAFRDRVRRERRG